eukprot:1629664-Alexandrium_andersonii.AAC.1
MCIRDRPSLRLAPRALHHACCQAPRTALGFAERVILAPQARTPPGHNTTKGNAVELMGVSQSGPSGA